MRASVGIGALVQPLDRMQRAADEQRLQHHVVPAVLGELLLGIGIAMRHRLEHRRACWCACPRRAWASSRCGSGIERQAAIEGDLLADVGGAAELGEARGEGLARRRRLRAGSGCAPPDRRSSRAGSQPGRARAASARSASLSARSALPSLRGAMPSATYRSRSSTSPDELAQLLAEPGAGGLGQLPCQPSLEQLARRTGLAHRCPPGWR